MLFFLILPLKPLKKTFLAIPQFPYIFYSLILSIPLTPPGKIIQCIGSSVGLLSPTIHFTSEIHCCVRESNTAPELLNNYPFSTLFLLAIVFLRRLGSTAICGLVRT